MLKKTVRIYLVIYDRINFINYSEKFVFFFREPQFLPSAVSTPQSSQLVNYNSSEGQAVFFIFILHYDNNFPEVI